jgi:hypothetical protein
MNGVLLCMGRIDSTLIHTETHAPNRRRRVGNMEVAFACFGLTLLSFQRSNRRASLPPVADVYP